LTTSSRRSNGGRAAYVQLQAFLAEFKPGANGRLPAERELMDMLGVTRGEVRKALAIAEAEGHVWRHVGKGTFLGPKAESEPSGVLAVAHVTSPGDLMRARILFESELCREAARNATAADFEEIKLCLERSRHAETWRHYESWDNRFHRAIAEATQNKVLVSLFDNLNAIRRALVWARRREDPAGPAPSHHSFTEHDAIAEAIEHRDLDAASDRMRNHLEAVARNMISSDWTF
jgi:DNA-binding FadR family transcriptional regulator